MTNPIRHVSDTALWVAMYRAFESERPDALFRDPHARRMAGERGEQIVRSMPRGRSMAWPMIVRTAVMDEIILRLVADGVGTVVNLAAGLDTRAFRMVLPRSVRWFDVDLPDMVAYRKEHLADAKPACIHEHVAADLTDPDARAAVLSRVEGGHGSAMVVTEGLLVYLTPGQVRALADQLHDVRSMRWWLTDLGTPLLLKMLRRTWQSRLSAANAPMQFAPAEGTAFFGPSGWREAEFRSVWLESRRLDRTIPLSWLWNVLSRLRSRKTREAYQRMSAIVLLERT
jgi:methyltransferase (TIGR00027 family)